MFGQLSIGTTLYVIDKTGEQPMVVEASIANTTGSPWMNAIQGSTVDIKVSYPDGRSVDFTKLPANAPTFAYADAVVCETNEQLLQQLECELKRSEKHLEDTSWHENAIPVYKDILKRRNPSYAAAAATEERFERLEDAIAKTNATTDRLASLMEKMLNSSSRSAKS